MPFILQRDIPGLILSRTNISFRATKYGTKLSYSLLLQKYITVFDNNFTQRLHNLKYKGMLPSPQNNKFWPLHRWCTWMMAYGDQYLLFNFCITIIELKLNAKHMIQIHQWHVGVIGFTNVHLCCQCTKQCQKFYARFLQNTLIALLVIFKKRPCA